MPNLYCCWGFSSPFLGIKEHKKPQTYYKTLKYIILLLQKTVFPNVQKIYVEKSLEKLVYGYTYDVVLHYIFYVFYINLHVSKT